MTAQNTWQGTGLFFESATTALQDVGVMIAPDGITISHNESRTFFGWNQLRMTTTASGAYVRIEVKTSGSILTLQSVDALNALAANHQIRKGILGRLTPNQQVLWGTITFIVVAVLFFTVGLDVLADAGTNMVSLEMEKKLGSFVMESIVGNERGASDSATARVLERCAAIVSEFDGPSNDVAYNITLIEDDKIVNAFALPGGSIVVYRGMMNKLENEAELFGLLGHEVGHVALRHGVKRIVRTAVLGIITSILIGDAGGVTSVLLENGNMLVNLSYDRQEELDADEFGLNAIRQADIDARGIVTLFEKLQKAEGSSEWLTFLSTHPDTEKRLQELRTKLPTLQETRQRLTDEEWKTLKRIHRE